MKQVLSSAILLIFSISVFAQLSGSYTIGGTGANYSSVVQAVDSLNTLGVSGPVVFNIKQGTYNGQVEVLNPTGVSATNTVTFRPDVSNTTPVIISHSAASSLRSGTFVLNNVDYVNIDSLTIQFGGTAYGHAIELYGGSSNIEIDGCKLGATQFLSSTSSNTAVVYDGSGTGNMSNNITIQNCELKYGGYSMYVYGSSSANQQTGWVVKNNDISEFNYYGTYFYYTNVSYVDNKLNRSGLGYAYPYCASYFRYCYNTEFRRNTIYFNASTYAYYGVYFQYCYATNTSRKYFSNNIVNVPKSYYTALYAYNANYVDFKYNTFRTGTGRAPSYATARIDNGALSVIENNIFHNETGVLAGQFSGTQTRNYNNFYSAGSKANVALGANSQTVDPLFVSSTDLHVQNVKLNGKANADTAIKVDFEGDSRSASHDIGADEFSPPNLDLKLATLNDLYCLGSSSVTIGLSNFGLDTIKSAKISWSIAKNNSTPVAQPDFTFSGSLLSGLDTNVSLGSFNFYSDTTYQIWAYIDSVNGGVDLNQTNDSIQTDTFRVAMNGTYYVGGTNPDFTTPSAAVTALMANGVCGPVVLKLRSGTYNGQVNVGTISGTSAINSVLVTRDTGSTQPIITSTSSTPTILFNNTSYVTVKDLSILSETFNGKAIQLTNDNSYLKIDSCFVKTDTNSRSSGCAAFYKTNNGFSKYISIENSELVGGYYSIYSNGSSVSYDSTLSVKNSKLSQFYNYGVYVYYHEKCELKNNIINNMDRVGLLASRGGGVYMYYSKNIDVQSNQVVFNATNTSYGVYFYYCNGTNITNRSKIINNMISLPNLGAYSGTYNYYANDVYLSNYTEFKFNNIYVASGGSTFHGCRLNGTGLEAYNNNIVVKGDGSAMYKQGSITENYNNLFARSGVRVTPITSPVGPNTISINPGYYSTTDLHTTSIFLNGTGVPVAGVTTDIDGDVRNVTSPDIGADEFTPVANDLTPLGITSPIENVCGQDSVDLYILVQNNGLNTQTVQPMTGIVVSPWPTTLVSSGTKTIASGAIDTVYMGKINTSFGGNFVFKLISNLSNDQKKENDTLDILKFKVYQTPAVPYVGSGIVACSDIDTMLIASTSAKEIRWFDSLGAAPIFIGDSFPINLSNADTFWVMGSNDYSDNLGIIDRSLHGGTNNTGITQGLMFSVERELVIDTVTVYPNDSGTVVVRLLNSSGILLRDTSFSVNTSGVAHLPIGFRVYPGDGYTLDATGTATSGLWRSYSPRYPYYDSDSAMSITGPKSGSTYYYDFFYDWRISVEGCESGYRTVPVGVRPSLNVNLGVDTGYCVGNTFNHTFSATNSGASSYKWQNNSTQSTFNVTTQGTYWVDVTAPNGCVTRDSVEVTEVALPTVVFNGAFHCENEGAIQILGSPAGGSVTGSGAVNGLYYPSLVGPGSYSVTYYYEDSLGCGSSDTGTITVGVTPVVTVTPPASICQSKKGEPLSGGMPAGGYYYGKNVQSNKLFSPSPGIDTVNYVYYSLNGCHDTATATIQVLAAPNIVWGGIGTVCTNTPVMTLNATPTGGTYTGGGTTGNTFDPAVVGAGSQTITYDITGTNGCSSSESRSFIVYPTPFVSLSSLPTACADKQSYSLSNFGFPNSGTYTGAFVDGANKTFDVVAAGAGTHPVNYVVSNQYGCMDSATQSIVVKPLPTVDFGGDKDICGSQTVELDAENPGASYVWNTGETSRYITVGTSGKFIVTITENGCQGTDSVTVTYSESCVGIDPNFTDGASISIYPNPASVVLNIDIKGIDNELMTFSIMTLSGQDVLTFDPQLVDQSFNQSIDLSGLSVGVYLLKVSSEKGNSIYRVSISE
ncbi:MAG: T9SS type A sorting domain-containing protein [Salibacteraceae bacterium]